MSNVQLIVGQLINFLLYNIGGIRHGIHVEAEQKIRSIYGYLYGSRHRYRLGRIL